MRQFTIFLSFLLFTLFSQLTIVSAWCTPVQVLPTANIGLETASYNITTVECNVTASVTSWATAAAMQFAVNQLHTIISPGLNSTFFTFVFAIRGYENMWSTTPGTITIQVVAPNYSNSFQTSLVTNWPQPSPASLSTYGVASTVGSGLDVCYTCGVNIYTSPDWQDAVANPTVLATNSSMPGLQQLTFTPSNGLNQTAYAPYITFRSFAYLANASAQQEVVWLDIFWLPPWINLTSVASTQSPYTSLTFSPTPQHEGFYMAFKFVLEDAFNIYDANIFAVQIAPAYPFWGTNIAGWFWMFPAAMFLCIGSVAVYQIRSGCIKKEDDTPYTEAPANTESSDEQ